MNCYIIINPAFEDKVCSFISGEKIIAEKKGRDLLSPTEVLVANKKDYDAETFKSAFKKSSPKDTVFIMPELDWECGGSVNEGYEIALDLLNEKIEENRFFNLVFISNFTKDRLRGMVKKEYVELVKSFPHICLDTIGGSMPKYIPVRFYSDIHFELLKKVIASKSGRLDYIKHRLSYLKEPTIVTSAREEIVEYLEILHTPFFTVAAPEMSQALAKLDDLAKQAESPKDIKKLVDGLFQYINELTGLIGDGKTVHKKRPFSVLIIEDEPFFQKHLKSFFGRFFSDVKVYTGPEITNAPELIEKDAGRYNIVILDMMYTATGKRDEDLLPFNGFDLVRTLRKAEAKNNLRKAAIRVITALPRNELASLVTKRLKIESPNIFTKGNGWKQLEGCLVERMDEILSECKKYDEDYRQAIPYPKNGVFAHPGMKEALDANHGKFMAAIKFADEVVYGNRKLTSGDTLTVNGEDDPKELLRHLNATMAHRKLVIEYLLKTTDCKFDEKEYRKFILDYITHAQANQKGNDNTPYRDRYINTQLGFSVTALPDSKLTEKDASNYVKIIDLEEELNLFPQELDAPRHRLSNTMQNFLDTFVIKLETEAMNDTNGSLAPAFLESGISDFLGIDKTKVTVRALIELLKTAFQYVKDCSKDLSDPLRYSRRERIFQIISHCTVHIVDFPHTYLFAKHQEPELIEWVDKWQEYDFFVENDK